MKRTDLQRAALALAVEERARAIASGPVAGIDEAGRGPLAGPVVAAAVVLRPDIGALAARLRDSKELPPKARTLLAATIRSQALAWSVFRVSSRRIDRIGIEAATSHAMRAAVCGLPPWVAAAVVDGPRVPEMTRPAWPRRFWRRPLAIRK